MNRHQYKSEEMVTKTKEKEQYLDKDLKDNM